MGLPWAMAKYAGDILWGLVVFVGLGFLFPTKPTTSVALLAVVFISYIQPFEDGNKRTGRITGNGIRIDNGYCPLSYRSVRPVDYKKAMILFYVQNNLSAYKKLSIEQFAFAVNNYFR